MNLRVLLIFAFLAIALSIAANGNQVQDNITTIHTTQGDGQSSPLDGKIVTIQAVVIGYFQGKDRLNGFYLQEEDSDADNLDETSEGIFVYDPGSLGIKEKISSGDLVKATGKVNEFNNLTQIYLTKVEKAKEKKAGAVTAVVITLPVENVEFLERYEGMLTKLPQEFIITANYNFSKFGEKTISPNARLPNPTNIAKPGGPANSVQALNNRSVIILDDGSKLIYPKSDPFPRTLRSGDSVHGIVGILSYDFKKYRGFRITVQ
jgi:predicted extracellular nuclease